MTYPYPDKRFESAQKALNSLQSEEKNKGYFLDMRPNDTKVQLYRDENELKIITPEFHHLGCCVYLFLGIPLTYVLATLTGGFVFLIYFVLLPVVVGLLNSYEFRFLRYHKILSINKSKNTIGVAFGTGRKNAWAIQKYHKTSRVQNINLLAYNPGYEFDSYVDSRGKQHNRSKVTIPPKLSIYAGSFEYYVGSVRLSKAEYWWLAQELSDFLGLEVKIIYPTPKMPPESSCGGC
ncbi:MAG: hypothetical protein QNJ64_18870 [Crocosphaera sp.]|nr:hypothetical protein [Crocosphaera sp.]